MIWVGLADIPQACDSKQFQQRLNLHDYVVVLVRHVVLRAEHVNFVQHLEDRVHPWVLNLKHVGSVGLTQDLAYENDDIATLLVEVALKKKLFQVEVRALDWCVVGQRYGSEE